jgi:hypothetical protein
MVNNSETVEKNRAKVELPRDVFNQFTFLDPSVNYLWILDSNLSFVLAPERQELFALDRVKCKHGDLTSLAGKYLLGSVDNLTTARGPARMGGELKYDYTKQKWVIDNDSSYSFFRDDRRVLSNASGVKWQEYITKLFRTWHIDVDDIEFLDLVQSRKLDSFIVQKLSHGYSKFLRTGAVGANVFFLTEGKLHVQILDTRHVSSLVRYSMTEPHIYCKVNMKGSESLKQTAWWKKPQRTTSCKSRAPKWDETLDVYVTDSRTQVLEIKLMLDLSDAMIPDQVLGTCDVELDRIHKDIDEWINVQPLVPSYAVEDTLSDSDCESPVLDAFSLIGKTIQSSLSTLSNKTPSLHVKLSYVPHITPVENIGTSTIAANIVENVIQPPASPTLRSQGIEIQ